MWLEVTDGGSDVVEDLLNERHHFHELNLHKVTSTFLSYLDERVARHVLDTIVSLCAVNERGRAREIEGGVREGRRGR